MSAPSTMTQQGGRIQQIRPSYSTSLGAMYESTVENFLESEDGKRLRRKVNLIFTSPPFPLNRKKSYGNLQGEGYVEWIAGLAPTFAELLTPDGSIVIELGNAWQPGSPTMSTLALEALLAFRRKADLQLCQQFVCHNPNRLPSPAQWVTVTRQRLTDAHTHVWWFAKTAKPKADNRKVLRPYSKAMEELFKRQSYNAGARPSEHHIGEESFLKNNGGAIPSSVLTFANTSSQDAYLTHCRERGLQHHPARMPVKLAEFFIRYLTEPGDLIYDPFAGSNTTGFAAESLQRRWIATEPVAEFVEGSKARFVPAITL